MLAYQIGLLQFYALLTVLAGGVGRLTKGVWPTASSEALQAIVILFAMIGATLDARLGGASWQVAATLALVAIASGGLASGGHEILKKMGTRALSLAGLSQERATQIVEFWLGKLVRP